ncbi:3-hydroxyacyl-CoA dehydrogenase NAD-binding domain-containing protein [Variovorax sp. GB1P17]|uniref:3-hydroxyacyl-CoA dehydrogenase NAD-binding domain-containing protein n=1 Tax=Variovorax sp. GB1P17 TaxID=3443740 RepID=UPI003F45B743
MTLPVTLSTHGRIGVITVHSPPVNALSQAVRAGLLEAVLRGGSDPALDALVLVCKGRTFIVGADIREFGQPMREPQLAEVVSAIARSAKPVIAAMHGTALGGGFELALACQFRVALASAQVGLPEVKLGILPGCGGTQRLPRLIGVEEALRLVVEGNPIGAARAMALGAIDAVIDGDLLAGSLAFAEEVVAGTRPMRRIGEPPVAPVDPRVFDGWEASVAKKFRGFLAPARGIQAIRGACELALTEGLAREGELSRALLASPQSDALRHLFFAEREVGKVPGLPEGTPVRGIASVAVIGCGSMGAGITQCFLNAGLPVLWLSRSEEGTARGLGMVRKNYAGGVARGTLTQAAMDQRLALLTMTMSWDALGAVDLVIEAVAEDMAAKQAVFAELDRVCKPGAILATNTSYLSIDALADATRRPGSVVGMHFFNPAHVMKLLENVRGAKTAPDVLATVMQLGKTLGKQAVLVGMCDGFVGNRMLARRSREGFFMLEEGATPWQIDKVLFDFGFPMGPYAMSDLAGLDVAWAARKARWGRLTPREQACDILDQLCRLQRYGQKTGRGYYSYDDRDNPQRAMPDADIEALIAAHSQRRGLVRRAVPHDEILERCLFAMVNEGARILEEGMASRALDIDVVWVHGFGFPRYRGGPMFHADQIGLKRIHRAIQGYQQTLGAEHWTPSPLLARLAREGKGFYSL